MTKPFLPHKEDYLKYIDSIWDRHWLTNNGPLVNELESKLKDFLDVSNILFLANGTLALQLAVKALELKGEIITTPFSYVATTSSIVWENCKPVYVDIDEHTFNIDHTKIEEAITENTSGILITHVFGNACAIDEIQAIADKHNLKVIYDAAHCFGTTYKGRSIFEYGDISTTSFHATKLFHTIEGGAVFTPNKEHAERMSLLRNFGHTSAITFDGAGINAKNSEFHAAMGLCCLEKIGDILDRRKEQWNLYYQLLDNKKGIQLLEINPDCEFNYAYFPVVLDDEAALTKITDALNLQYVMPRRYFYPSLNTLDYVEQHSCPVSESISERVLCLPLYHTLTREDQDMIVRVINKQL